MMDSFSEYLSHKYTEISIENPDHFKTIIIRKVVQMFHTLELLANKTQDEVSARCVLRGILDNVTTYCFIYDRDDINDIMFRHYLYAIDGYVCFKNNVVNGIMMVGNGESQFEQQCDEAIRQFKEQLGSHPFSLLENEVASKLTNNANWKYLSLQNPQSVKFRDMYLLIGLNKQLSDYYQGYLSQFVHGLSFSNIPCMNPEQINNVLYESIPLADRMIQAICSTFPKKEMLQRVSRSKIIKKLHKEPDFNADDLFTFVKALIRKDRILYV